MLDWDKPLSQQAPEVQKTLLDQWKSMKKSDRELAAFSEFQDYQLASKLARKNMDDASGRLAYNMLTHHFDDPAAASALLREKGIPGIRFLDGGSRGAGAGTSNYVVFPGEESALTILERNGTPINRLVQALKGTP